jgi:hypothetical protein
MPTSGRYYYPYRPSSITACFSHRSQPSLCATNLHTIQLKCLALSSTVPQRHVPWLWGHTISYCNSRSRSGPVIIVVLAMDSGPKYCTRSGSSGYSDIPWRRRSWKRRYSRDNALVSGGNWYDACLQAQVNPPDSLDVYLDGSASRKHLESQ